MKTTFKKGLRRLAPLVVVTMLVGCSSDGGSAASAWPTMPQAQAASNSTPFMQRASALPTDVPEVHPFDDGTTDTAEENPIARLVDSGAPAKHPLENFYRALEAIENQAHDARPVRITQIGDSHTASDTFTGPLRTLLQDRFGDAGRGYLYAGTPWSSYRQADASYSMSSGWNGGVGIRGGAEQFSFGGARVVTSRNNEWIERAPCKRCVHGKLSEIHLVSYLAEPEGGSFEVKINGLSVATIDTSSPTREVRTWRHETPSQENTLRVETRGAKRVTLFGISQTRKSPGVVLDSVGINGAMARHFLAMNDRYSVAELSAMETDLFIFAFGANESVSSQYSVERPQEQTLLLLQKLDNYRHEAMTLLARWRQASPNAECLVLLPPDIRTRGDEPCVNYRFDDERLSGSRCVAQPPSNFAGLLNALRYAALSSGCAVWDQQHAMGGAGSIDVWHQVRLASADGVHLSASGYSALAHGFFQDLMTNWSAWRSGIHDPLSTGVIHPSLATSAREVQ